MATVATTAPASASGGGDPAAGRVLPRARPGRGAGLLLWPLVCVQAAGALVLGAVAADSPWLGTLAVLPAGLLALVVAAGLRGESPAQWLGSALALRGERRRATRALPQDADPLFSLAAECRPGLRVEGFVPRGGREGVERREMGMAAEGGTLTVVLRVEAAPVPLRPAAGGAPLPLSVLYEALDTDGIRLESVQSVQFTQPAPAPMLPERSVAGTSYALVPGYGGSPALRLTWVALRLDPELCPQAVAERGGGLPGARRALARAADQLASRLAGAGCRATVLSRAELLSAVAACAGSDPAATTLIGRGEGRPRRTAESARVWRCDGRWHATYRVARWPALGRGAAPLPALVTLLTSPPGFATTFALTLRRRGRGRDAVALSGHVRVTGRGEEELRSASRELLSCARAGGVGLARMDRRQLAGLQATLPLGGEC